MIDGTEKNKIALKFSKHTVQYNEFRYINNWEKIAAFAMTSAISSLLR